MEPRIVKKDGFKVIGVSARGNPQAIDYSDIWGREFMARYAELSALSSDGDYYGVYFDTDEAGIVDFIAGIAAAPDAEAPEGLAARDVPGATFAVFDGTMSTIGATWEMIMSQWLPQSAYEYDASKVSFEFFAADMGEGPDAPMMIYVPVTGG